MQDPAFRDLVERVKAAHPIEEVVGARVEGLKRAGSIYKACCPFHAEKTPSFTVDPSRGSWRCFGACSEGGDVLEFLVKFEGSTFWEALSGLAKAAGIELPERRSGGGPDAKRFAPLYESLERAERLFGGKLRGEEGERARAYLKNRGLRDETLRAFGVGFAPTGNVLLKAVQDSSAPLEPLVASGLIRRGEDDRPYDFFRGRIMIPIRDIEGRTVGFGARLLPGVEGPKYVNTPETPVFHKGRIVYGLDRALAAARRERHLCLVEGYTDVMAAHQVGCSHVAAVLGTATTHDHARLVRRSGARRVSLFFDGDAAGRKAVHKALRGLLGLDGVVLDVVRLPEGSDPCDLLVREQRAGFDRLVRGAEDWFEFLLAGIRSIDASATSDLVAAVDALVETVVCVQHPVGRDALIARAASALGLDVGALREQAGRALRQVQRASDSASARRSAGLRGPRPGTIAPSGNRRGHSGAAHLGREDSPNQGAETQSGAGPERGQAAAAAGRGRPQPGSRHRGGSRGNQIGQFDVQQLRVGRAWRHFTGSLLSDNGLIPVHREAAMAAFGVPGVAQGRNSEDNQPKDRNSNQGPSKGDTTPYSATRGSDALDSGRASEPVGSLEPVVSVDSSAVSSAAQLPPCPDPRVTRVLRRLLELFDENPGSDAVLDGAALGRSLGAVESSAGPGGTAPNDADHSPSGENPEATFPLELENLARLAESPRECAEQALVRLGEFARTDRLRGAKRKVVIESGLERDPSAWSEADHCRLLERYQAELELEPAPSTSRSEGAHIQEPSPRNQVSAGTQPLSENQRSVSPLSSYPKDERADWSDPGQSPNSQSNPVPAPSESVPDLDDFFDDGADSLTFDLLS